MERLSRYSEHALALLRVVAGLLFACHGAQKLFGLLGGFMGQAGATAPLGSLPWFAGLIELVCGVLIALGLLVRPLAILASGEMAVAYFMVHAPRAFWPIQNQGELAVLYCFLFLYLFFRGGGRFALDQLIFGRRGGVVSPAGAAVR